MLLVSVIVREGKENVFQIGIESFQPPDGTVGFGQGFKERNMKIHCCVMILVILAGAIFRIAAWKWCICFCLFGLVMSLEIVNTAVEAVVDLVTEERKPLAKLAKDAAAGAVLLAAIMAVIAGLILFLPEGLEFLCMVLK